MTGTLRTPGGWYTSLWEGKLATPDALDTYMNLFVVLAMARYAQASGAPTCATRPGACSGSSRRKPFPATSRRMASLAAGATAGAASRPWANSPATTCFTIWKPSSACAMRARSATRRPGLRRARFLPRPDLDPIEFVTFDTYREGFHDPDRSPGAYVSLAHGLEWFGFFREWPGAELPEAPSAPSSTRRCITPSSPTAPSRTSSI